MRNLYLPNFLIIGAPKCGSTSIYHHLRAHPDIYMPNNTELRFFNNEQVMNHLGGPNDDQIPKKICKNIEEYEAYFEDWSGKMAIGECTTSYLYYNEGLENIKSTLGDKVKLIVLLREPVARSFSHYQYFVRRNKEKLSFEEAIREEKLRKTDKWNEGWLYIENSLYSSKIKSLIDLGLDFKVFLFENLKNDPEKLISDIYAYLEVDTQFKPTNLGLEYNKGGVYKNRKLINWLQSPSTIRSLVKKVFPSFLTNKLREERDKFIVGQTVALTIKKETETELKSFFKDDVKELQRILDLDLTAWGYDL